MPPNASEDWHLKRVVVEVFGLLFADGGRSAIAVRRSGAAANCATLQVALSLYYFHTLPFVRTKGNLKTAAVKRFRGRPCVCAESDAYGIFEDQKVSDF